MHLQLACPNCSTSTKANNINIIDLVAKCHHCDAVFNFSQDLLSGKRDRPEIMLPPGFEAFTTLSTLDIEFSWKQTSQSLGFLIFFALFWNGILSVFVVTAIMSGTYGMILGCSVHLLIGICLTYYILTVLLNKTHILVSRREIQIEHGPLRLPFYPNRNIAASDLNQLFIKKYTNGKTNGRPNYAFSVTAQVRTGSNITLVKGLKRPEQATYIEQQIEKFLHIEDKAMAEEWRM